MNRIWITPKAFLQGGKRFSVAAGVQSGTDLWEPSSQLARCAA